MSLPNDDTTWNRMHGEHRHPLAPDYEDYSGDEKSTDQKQLERQMQIKQAKQSTMSWMRDKEDDRMGKSRENPATHPHSNKIRHYR